MQEFTVDVDGWGATVTIIENTITLTVPGWYHPTHEITPELPEEMRLRANIGTIEEFSRRPGFKIETGELPYLVEDGEEFDTGRIIKLYDDAHGGGGVWCLGYGSSEDFTWGMARGRMAVLADGTILREGRINSTALATVRQRREGEQP